MKNVLRGGIALVVLAVGVGLYMTRSVEPSTPASEAVAPLGETGKALVLKIVPAESTVSYTIDEVLRDVPTRVVGVTSAVAGEVALTPNPAEPFRIGELAINARTLKTDSDRRDGAVARMILKSELPENEFIVLKNLRVQGLNAPLTPGVTSSFTATGDLKISGVTLPATFAVEAVLDATNVLRATAKTTVKRSDFKLVVPDLPFLADVADEVLLTATLVFRQSAQ